MRRPGLWRDGGGDLGDGPGLLRYDHLPRLDLDGGQGDVSGGGLEGGLPGGGEVPDQKVGDGGGLLHRHEVGGAGHDGQPGVRHPGDQRAGLGGAGDLVVRADQHQRRHADAAEVGPYVERGEGLAGGDVAARVGGAHHLHGPLGDRGLRGRETTGEPAVGRGTGDRVEPVRADDHPALAELVGGAEPGRGGDQGEGGETFRVAQGQFEADRAAERAARVAEALHAEAFEGGEQPSGEIADRPPGYAGAPPCPGRSNRNTRHCFVSSGICRSHMCHVVPSEGPRISTGASSGPSQRYCRVGVVTSLTRATFSHLTISHMKGSGSLAKLPTLC